MHTLNTHAKTTISLIIIKTWYHFNRTIKPWAFPLNFWWLYFEDKTSAFSVKLQYDLKLWSNQYELYLKQKNCLNSIFFFKLSSFLFKFVFDPCLLGLKNFSGPQNFSLVAKENLCTHFCGLELFRLKT